MRFPPSHPEEAKRLAALSEYSLSSDSMETELSRILDLATNLFEVPTVLVSLVESERQIFPARIGLDVCETDRTVSFCAHALQQQDVFVVLDAALDPRFFDNPLVTGGPKIRFYAGAPLIAPSGLGLGSLCIIDTKPRSKFSQTDQKNLQDLAELVLDRMELRRLSAAQRASQIRFEQIAATSPDGIICTDGQGMVSFWNRAAEVMFGYSADEMTGKLIATILPYPLHENDKDQNFGQEREGSERPWIGKTLELKARRKSGDDFLAELSLSCWREGNTVSYGAIVRDITERRLNDGVPALLCRWKS